MSGPRAVNGSGTTRVSHRHVGRAVSAALTNEQTTRARVECLEQLPAVPRCVRHHEDVPSEEVARQVGQPVGDLGDSGAGVGSQSNQGFL